MAQALDDAAVERLRRRPAIAHYFRYRLRAADFRPLACAGRPVGHYYAKPLYGRLTASGRVDRSAGFDGRIAVLFLPLSGEPRLLFTALPRERIADARGRRRWGAIRAAAEAIVCTALAPPPGS